MKKAIMAKKIGMTQVFTENGALVPVTVLEAGPCVVIQKKTRKTTAMKQPGWFQGCKSKKSKQTRKRSFRQSRRSC